MLLTVGYVREDRLAGIGQYSVRGGILDVWPPDMEMPARIEFFGDSVDSVRRFRSETQLSVEKLTEISLAPMREFAAAEQDLKDWSFFARDRFAGEGYARNLLDRTEFADEGETFTGWEFLLPLVKPLTGTIFDYLDDSVFLIDEPTSVEQTLAGFYDNLRRRFASLKSTGEIGLAPSELFLDADELRTNINEKQRIEIRALGRTAAAEDEQFSLPETSGGIAGRGGTIEPLFLFPTVVVDSANLEIRSRSTRKFHG
jgi:transcription-repair coupling factor (superfamily II helicase)